MCSFLFLFTGTTNDYERRPRGLRRVSGPYCEVFFFFFSFFIYIVLISYYFELDYVTPPSAAAAAATAVATPPSPSPLSATAAAGQQQQQRTARNQKKGPRDIRRVSWAADIYYDDKEPKNGPDQEPSAQRRQRYLKHRFSFFFFFFFLLHFFLTC